MSNTDKSAVVHMNVPMRLKGAWVAASRARSMKLGEWLVERIGDPSAPVAHLGSTDIDVLLGLANLTPLAFARIVGVDVSELERWRSSGMPALELEHLQLMAGVHPLYRLVKR